MVPASELEKQVDTWVATPPPLYGCCFPTAERLAACAGRLSPRPVPADLATDNSPPPRGVGQISAWGGGLSNPPPVSGRRRRQRDTLDYDWDNRYYMTLLTDRLGLTWTVCRGPRPKINTPSPRVHGSSPLPFFHTKKFMSAWRAEVLPTSIGWGPSSQSTALRGGHPGKTPSLCGGAAAAPTSSSAPPSGSPAPPPWPRCWATPPSSRRSTPPEAWAAVPPSPRPPEWSDLDVHQNFKHLV